MKRKIFNIHSQKATRKHLRNHPTKAEQILWMQIRKSAMEGYKFRRQHGIGPFIVDFYCPELKLAIEVDGYSHDSDDAQEKDARRQRFLEDLGIRVVRLKDDFIRQNCEGALVEMKRIISNMENQSTKP